MQDTACGPQQRLSAANDVPVLSMSESPDESLGDADCGPCAHYLRQDCQGAACLDLSEFALDEHTTRKLLLSLTHGSLAGEADTSISQLTSLRLSGARPQVPSTLLLELLSALRQSSPNIQLLDLSYSDFGDEVVELLASWVSPSLTVLDLSGNHLTDNGAAAVLTALRDAGAVLEKLSLSGSRLHARSAGILGDLLQTSWSHSLYELSLSRCGLDDSSASAIAEGVHRATALRAFDISHNAYSLSLASPLSPQRPVTLPASLRSLNLSGVLFKTVLVRGLAASLLPCCESLEELRLSGCLEGDEAFQALFVYLGCMPCLRVLDLSQCRLTYRSGKTLSQKLLVFHSLERVDLSKNLLDVEGVADLSSGLSRMQHLTSLYLEGCHLGNCGAVSVVSSIAHSTSPIREIDLSDNGITDVGIRDLCTQLTRDTSPKLHLLVLSRNPCTKESRVQLEDMMREQQRNCIVLARETPLDEVTAGSNSALSSASSSLLV